MRYLQTFLPLIALLLLVQPARAESYGFDPSATQVHWRAAVLNFSSATGTFKIKSGTLTIGEADTVEVTIDAASISTGFPAFDNLLRGPDFLETDKFPEAVFKSTQVTLNADKSGAKVAGLLTLHGVTGPVTLNVALGREETDPVTRKKSVGFRAAANISRRAFGISKYSLTVSDALKITISAQAVQK